MDAALMAARLHAIYATHNPDNDQNMYRSSFLYHVDARLSCVCC